MIEDLTPAPEFNIIFDIINHICYNSKMSKWTISYYNQSVQEAIAEWPKGLLAKYMRTIDLIEEFGPQIGPPHTKAMGNGLYEIRIKAKEGIGRSFFGYLIKNEIIILHSFIKKTQATPKKELDIARKRLLEVKS